MKQKIGSIFLIMLLIAMSLPIMTFSEPNTLADTGGGGEDDGYLDFDYFADAVTYLSNIIHNTSVYPPGEIKKGRYFGSDGDKAAAEYLRLSFIDDCGFDENDVRKVKLGYIDEEHCNYTEFVEVTSYGLTINHFLFTWSTGLSETIPQDDCYPLVATRPAPGNPDCTVNTNFDNVIVYEEKDFIKRFPKWQTGEQPYYLSFDALNDCDLILGEVVFVPSNETVPPHDYQTVFLFEEDQGVEDKIENATKAAAIILLQDAPVFSFQNAENYHVPIARVDTGNESNNQNLTLIKQLLQEEHIVIANSLVHDNKITFVHNMSSSECGPDWNFVILFRATGITIDGYNGLIDIIISCCYRYWFFNKIRPFRECQGILIYDDRTVDCHYMYNQFIDTPRFKADKFPMFALPGFSVNQTVGEFLKKHSGGLFNTISGHVNQIHYKEDDEPGVVAHNVEAYLNITHSPGDRVVVLSSRYDSMMGECAGDSAAGNGIIMGIAKYMQEMNQSGIKPKYDVTFLLTTNEENGYIGAEFFSDSHNDNIYMWIGTDQLGFNHGELHNVYKNESHKNVVDAIVESLDYSSLGYGINHQLTSDPEINYLYDVKNPPYGQSGVGAEDVVFYSRENCDTILIHKGDAEGDPWQFHHGRGLNLADGDVIDESRFDWADAKMFYNITWETVKYFLYNPDCWFDGTISYSGMDSPDDPDPKTDSISATFTVKSVLPNDKVRVNATVKSWPSNDVIFWKNYDFIVTSEGTQKTVIVTLPPDSTGASTGNYYLTLSLLNSTGKINDIAFNTRAYNDADTQTGYVYLYPRGNSDPDKPTDITCDSTIQSGKSANFTTSTVDSNQDQMQYQWDWNVYLGDLIETTEVGPYDSGEDCPTTHTYIGCGPRVIQVRARDDYGYLFDGSTQGWNRYGDTWSDWSEPLEIWVHFFTDFSMSCTSLSSAVSAKYATELPSIQQINSMYTAVVFGCNDPFTYQWVFNHERYADQNKTVGYQFQETGEHLVSLNVTDDDGYSEEFSVNVSVVNLSASFNLSIPSPYANPDEEIYFTDTSAIASGYHLSTWTWDFDDGAISYDQNVTHEFVSPGTYNVSLTVTDNQSHSDVASKRILVSTDETSPQIQQVIDEITIDDRWLAMSIAGYFIDSESGIQNAYVNITYPNGSHGNFTMMHVFNTMYGCTFNDTNTPGQYNYTIWVTDYENNTCNATGYSFTIPEPPVLLYAAATPADNTSSNDNWIDLNVTVLDPLNTSAFIDWDRGLKGYWPMESYNDTGVYDNSTYENFGTFQNGMNTRNIIPGKYGDGLEFDGSDDYLDVGTNNCLDLGTGDFTFMVWEKSYATLYSKKAMILTNSPASESWKGYGFGVVNGPYLIVSQSSGNNVTVQGTVDVTDNSWHHIAYVCRSGDYFIYVDSEEDADIIGVATRNITNSQSTTIAYDGHCSSWCYFDGTLDELQLYDRALSWEEINTSYNNGVHRLYRNFTGLSDGIYTFYAHAIDTSGNQSVTETRQILIDTIPPVIADVNASPHTVGFEYPVTITADVTDNGSGVDLVAVQITLPGVVNSSNYTMTLISNNTYCYVFNDTWVTGQYNYTIWTVDNANNSNSSSGHHFHVSAEATISIATLQDSYSGNQYINITDPPNPPENYTLVGRGLTWNTYYNATTGQNILETYQGPVNYQEDNGTWTPINNTITPLASNHPAYIYGYRNGNDQGLYGVYFKSNAQQDWPVAFSYNRSDDPTIHAVRSKLVGVGYVDPQSNWAYQYLQNAQSSQGQTNSYSITYPGIFTGTDVTWSYGNTGLKEEITLSNATKTVLQNHPPSQYGLNDASSYLVFITKLDYQNLNLYNDSGVLNGNVTVSDAEIDLKDALGQFKCALPLGEAYELNNQSARQKLTYRIIHLNGNTYLLSGLKVSDLNAMTFPVVVDPTLTVYSLSSDGYIYNSGSSYSTVQSASTGTVDSSSSYLTIGQKKVALGPTYYVYRGFVFFNTSTLPSNAYLDNATLSIYKKDDYSTTDFDITIQNGQSTYPHNPMQTGDYFRNYYSGNGGTLGTSRFTSGYNAITMSNLSWINKTGITKLCLRSSRDISGTAPTGNEYVNVYSNEFLGMNPPRLVINYRNQSKIKNTGSTDIKGYLLIQVQFYNSTQGKWLVDDDTINETTPRTITSGNQLALDTIFNGHVRASDLTHGTGTYRVYAAFRDPEGNILKTNSGVELKAWWQFSKT